MATGDRSQAWLFEPAWPPSGQTYQITYEFKTEIITSRSGKEQRLALRSSARKSVSYQCLLAGDQFREFKDLMWHWQHRSFVLPELTRFVDSSEDQAADTASMTFGQIPAWVVPDASVMVMYQGFTELRVVESVDGMTVTFRSMTGSVWPAGTRMYAALAGHMAPSLDAPRETNAVAQLGLQFTVDPLSEPRIAPAAATTMFQGREVFLKRPNWANRVDVQIAHDVQVLDYGRGPVARFTPVEFGFETRKANYINRNTAEAEAIRDFFFRMKGRQGEFYMPTWEYDFVPKTVAPVGTASLRVAGADFATAYGNSTVHRAMFVLMNNGEVLFREVLSVAAVTDAEGVDSLITIGEPWDRDIAQEGIVMCGWMPVWRFVSDNLVIEWLTNSVAQVSLNMMTLEDLPVETA